MDIPTTPADPQIYAVDILANGDSRNHAISVKEFLYNNKDFPEAHESQRFRWLHIPANHTKWAQDCIRKVRGSSNESHVDDIGLHVRPPQSHRFPVPPHAKHAQSLCLNLRKEPEGVTKPPEIGYFVPFMSWEIHSNFEAARKDISRAQTVSTEPDSSIECLHPRRTLDQYYYPSLADTKARDADQTVSKWTGVEIPLSGLSSAGSDGFLIMVDQLWVWTLPDEQTVISAFPALPTHDSRLSQQPKFQNLYDQMRGMISTCETISEVACILFGESVDLLFKQAQTEAPEVLEIYQWAIRQKTALQASYFSEFHLDQNRQSSSQALNDRQEMKLALEVADIMDELKMIHQLVNEQRQVFAMFMNSLNPRSGPEQNQEGITTSFEPGVINVQGDFEFNASSHIDGDPQGNITTLFNPGVLNVMGDFGFNHSSHATARMEPQDVKSRVQKLLLRTNSNTLSLVHQLNALQKDAEDAYKQVLSLLDLKQKASSLAEARSTTRQGKAIMLFTIVTIIFLPLSFFTSYFGQNVSEITGDPSNPSSWELWRIGMPVSVVIIFGALAIAFISMSSSIWGRFWAQTGGSWMGRDPEQ